MTDNSVMFSTSLPLVLHTTAEGNDPIRHNARHRLVTLEEVNGGGVILLFISTISLLINFYLTFLVKKSWRTIRKSPYFNTNFLCLLLAMADMVMAILVAFPAGVHMAWAEAFRSREAMMFYNQKVGYILFEYFFFLRVTLLAVLTADRAVHVMRPIKYDLLVTVKHLKYVTLLVLVQPFVTRALPNMIYLTVSNVGLICKHYVKRMNASDPAEFYSPDMIKEQRERMIPLTCVSAGSKEVALAEFIIATIITISSWLIITLSNLSILAIALKRARSTLVSNSRDTFRLVKMRRKLMTGAVLVLIVSMTFCLTNFPYICIWLADYLHKYSGHDQRSTIGNITWFYLTLLIFTSFLFNPWMYLFRMRIIRNVFPNIKRRISEGMTKTSQLILIPMRSQSKHSSTSNNMETYFQK